MNRFTAATQPRRTARAGGRVVVFALLLLALPACRHPLRAEIDRLMYFDQDYLALQPGQRRVDSLWRRAVDLTGSQTEALQLLGSIAVEDGIRLRHPFNTGLTEHGPLSPYDKTDHFFAHAMWHFNDQRRWLPVAGFNSVGWEVVGEIRSWFGVGSGFNWRDIWANQLGWEFARRVYENRGCQQHTLLPSDVITEAEQYRPQALSRD